MPELALVKTKKAESGKTEFTFRCATETGAMWEVSLVADSQEQAHRDAYELFVEFAAKEEQRTRHG